ncbi:hypothetical protein ILUMI_18706 [Ignelater luminosus]|uniref:Uncharacterized protein n=1 Tax=Ignelater luminosus TaxID=2038154 RepID=A0A8K0CNP0_IGNLU|nr:hypothetical protein ILUMI_18706 [Ignelater luminosus]
MDLDLLHPALRSKTLQVSINKIPTILVFNEYPTHYLVIVKQANGITAAGKILTRRDINSEFPIDILADCRSFKQVAQYMAANLKLDKLMLLILTLQDYGANIFNFDESGISTVLSTPKVLVDKAQKQISQFVSPERGKLVTFGGIISANGNTIPPLFVFPRVHYKDHFIDGAPEAMRHVPHSPDLVPEPSELRRLDNEAESDDNIDVLEEGLQSKDPDFLGNLTEYT